MLPAQAQGESSFIHILKKCGRAAKAKTGCGQLVDDKTRVADTPDEVTCEKCLTRSSRNAATAEKGDV